MDNSDFATSGILSPQNFTLPRRAFIAPRSREEAKEWVLAVSMDRSVKAGLASRNCAGCGKSTPECALVCAGCGVSAPPCIVTGFPILPGTGTTCRECNSTALAKDFDEFVKRTKTCVWCESR